MKYQWSILILGILFIFGCGNKENVLFEINLEERIEIPGGLNNIETHVFAIRDIPSVMDAYLTANGVNEADIVRIGPATASLQGEFQTYDYSNVADVEVDLLDANSSNRIEVFYQENVPFNQITQLDLFGSLTNVKDIMFGNDFDLEIGIRFRSPTVLSQRHLFRYKLLAYGQ